MAKIVNLNKNKNSKQSDHPGGMMKDFFGLLRAVVDGDKEAIEHLRFLLDTMEKEGFPMVGPKMEDDLCDTGFDGVDAELNDLYYYGIDSIKRMRLPREQVKEYRIRVSLNGTSRLIWREIVVPSDLTLEVLANILVDVMGWTGEHLFGFEHMKRHYCSSYEMKEGIMGNELDFSKYTISDILKKKGSKTEFDYDYGDGWEHDVEVVETREYGKYEPLNIRFICGFGACPPEDCGGVWGYEELLDIRQKKRKSKEDRERLDWYEMSKEYDFDPDDCQEGYCRERMRNWDERINRQ